MQKGTMSTGINLFRVCCVHCWRIYSYFCNLIRNVSQTKALIIYLAHIYAYFVQLINIQTPIPNEYARDRLNLVVINDIFSQRSLEKSLLNELYKFLFFFCPNQSWISHQNEILSLKKLKKKQWIFSVNVWSSQERLWWNEFACFENQIPESIFNSKII